MRYVLPALICSLFFTILGCSGTNTNPVTPSGKLPTPQFSNGDLSVGVSEYFPDGTPSGGMGILGLYNVHVDISTLTGEMVPARQGSLTDVLEVVDITGFLRISPCTDCAKLMSVELNEDENLVMNIGMKHPFKRGDPLKPITGQNRADLHVFNVEGTIISDGIGAVTQFSGLQQTTGNFTLLNADGYTPYLDLMLDEVYTTTATLHPYIMFFDNYGPGNFDPTCPTGFTSITSPGPQGNLVMPMGSLMNVQDFIFSPPAGEYLDFTFAVGCTYAVSAAKKADRFTPEYRVPQHNKKAASEVRVEVLNNELIGGIGTETATIQVKVLDINHGIPVGTALNEMYADSSVAAISIEIPGVTTVPVVATSPVPLSGDGRDPDNPLTFELTVMNDALGAEGSYMGLVKVLDSYSPGLNTSPLLDGMDGIKKVGPLENPLVGLFEIPEFATYQQFKIEVAPPAPDCFILTDPDPAEVEQGKFINLDGSNSTGHNPIVSYEWDFDYDGVTFDTDATGVTTSAMMCVIGTVDVALKVTDDRTFFSICTVPVTVIPAVANPVDGFGTDVRVSATLAGVETDIMGFRGIQVYNNDVYVACWDYYGSINGATQIWFMRSGDLGVTWDPEIHITNYTNANVTKDPAVCVDHNTGDIYVAYWTNGPAIQSVGSFNTDIMVSRSSDRGDTWEEAKASGPALGAPGIREWHSLALDDYYNPAYLYVSYTDSAAGHDIFVSNTTTDNFQNWSTVQVDDPGTSAGALQNTIVASPYDHSVMVTWGDAIYFGGNGSVRFDRSTDHGATWGTDVTFYTNASETHGPYNPVIAVNPCSGVPGVMWRSTLPSSWDHPFVKADNPEGTSWSSPVLADSGSTWVNWAGALSVTADGHWVACTMNNYRAWVVQSLDDGLTWQPGVNASDATSVYNPNLYLDENKQAYIFWTDVRSYPYNIYFDKSS